MGSIGYIYVKCTIVHRHKAVFLLMMFRRREGKTSKNCPWKCRDWEIVYQVNCRYSRIGIQSQPISVVVKYRLRRRVRFLFFSTLRRLRRDKQP